MAWLFSRIRQGLSVLLMLSLPLLALYPDTASAISAGQAFNSLLGNADISTDAPGYYHTEARNAFVAGGFDVHFANNNFQLINITPPSLNIGCGGISMFFGGFSFISGAQFSQLVQNIMEAALGYAIQLAIQTLCPACEAVLQVLQKAAQLANSLANNTCRMGQQLVNFGAKELGLGLGGTKSHSSGKGVTDKCAAWDAGNGGGSGFLSSLNSGVCQFAGEALNSIDNWMNQLSGAGAQTAANKMKKSLGNITWQSLHALGLTSSTELTEILLSLMGTDIVYPSKNNARNHYYPPLWSSGLHGGPKDQLRPLVFLYLCGAQQGNDQPLAQNQTATSIVQAESGANYDFCQQLANVSSNPWSILSSVQLYKCTGNASGSDWSWPSGDLGTCTAPLDTLPLNVAEQSWTNNTNEGFLRYVQYQLSGAVQNVEDGKALTTQEVALIQEAPFPLYQIINLAVVYPTTATELLANASQIIALLLTEHMIIDVMNNVSEASQFTVNNKKVAGTSQIIDLLSQLKAMQLAITQHALTLSTYELQMMHEVRQIQRLIQDQVSQEGLMGNQQYSQALMSNVTLNQPQPPQPQP